MPGFDVKNDVTPVNTVKPVSKPTIAALKSALSTNDSTTFSTTRLETMTENDLIYAARVKGLTVDGL